MNAVKTIDVKGLGHTEKEGLILPGVDALKTNETARIVVEFNPMPLVYMLKAQGEFEIVYEKDGPDEWILQVTRIAPEEDKKEQFKELLKGLKEGEVSGEAMEAVQPLLTPQRLFLSKNAICCAN